MYLSAHGLSRGLEHAGSTCVVHAPSPRKLLAGTRGHGLAPVPDCRWRRGAGGGARANDLDISSSLHGAQSGVLAEAGGTSRRMPPPLPLVGNT